MVNPLRNGSPDYGGSSAPYSPPSRSYRDSPVQRIAKSEPRPFQDLPGPAHAVKKYCGNCSAALEDKWNICPMCGTPPIEPIKRESLKERECTCGRTLHEDFRFCPSCSRPVDESWKQKPACRFGIIYVINAKFCIGCGREVALITDTTTKQSRRKPKS